MSTRNKDRGISRRTFLMGALATATAPVFLSSGQVRGATGPNEVIRLGCIGVGRQGRADMQEAIYRGLDVNARVVAVCDVDPARVAKAKELVEKIYAKEAQEAGPYEGCKTYADYRELLERKDLDGVLIVTPDHQHAVIAVAAAKAGKDIYLEKPMTLTIREGQELVRAVRANKRILQVGSQQRSAVYFRKACELVRNGKIGNLHTIRVTLPPDQGIGEPGSTTLPEGFNYDMWMGPTEEAPYAEGRVHPQSGFSRPGWLQIERYCKGMITGWGSHMNDIAQWGNGTDETGLIEIEAQGEFPERGLFDVHTSFKAEGKWANGVKLFQETGDPGVRFEGDEGWIFVSRNKLEASDPKILKEKIGPDGIRLYESNSHMRNFLECMRSRKDPIAPVEVGHRSNSLCLITHIAMKRGRRLEWDPKAERFTNDDQANVLLDYKHREPWSLA